MTDTCHLTGYVMRSTIGSRHKSPCRTELVQPVATVGRSYDYRALVLVVIWPFRASGTVRGRKPMVDTANDATRVLRTAESDCLRRTCPGEPSGLRRHLHVSRIGALV